MLYATSGRPRSTRRRLSQHSPDSTAGLKKSSPKKRDLTSSAIAAPAAEAHALSEKKKKKKKIPPSLVVGARRAMRIDRTQVTSTPMGRLAPRRRRILRQDPSRSIAPGLRGALRAKMVPSGSRDRPGSSRVCDRRPPAMHSPFYTKAPSCYRHEISKLVAQHFDLRPRGSSNAYLAAPDLREDAVGHFGRRRAGVSWERTDRATLLQMPPASSAGR